MPRKKKKSLEDKLLERIGLVAPRRWADSVRWWDKDKDLGHLPADPYSRLLYLSLGYRPDHRDLYEWGWLHEPTDGISPVFRGEVESPHPRTRDLNLNTQHEGNERFPILIERIRAVIFEQGQTEIYGTATEISEKFGYIDPAQFGRDITDIEDKLMEYGIDIERSRNTKKRLIKIYENQDSPYHPRQQNPPDLEEDVGLLNE